MNLFSRAPTVPVLRFSGPIGMSGRFRTTGFDFEGVVAAIDKAFSYKRAPCVAMIVNSPGGSPVQSSLICKRIRSLKREKGMKVVAFTEDVAASGGYFIACAADEIFCDESSILGSIGVISAGFGFTEAIDKIGVERRVYTAGENKAILDPLQPAKDEDVARLKSIQLDIHEAFKTAVRAGRGARLREDEPELFTGAFWPGKRAVELGLADGIGEVRDVLRERHGEKVKLKPIPMQPKGLFARLVGARMSGLGSVAQEPMAGWSADLSDTLEARALWARYGL